MDTVSSELSVMKTLIFSYCDKHKLTTVPHLSTKNVKTPSTEELCRRDPSASLSKGVMHVMSEFFQCTSRSAREEAVPFIPDEK